MRIIAVIFCASLLSGCAHDIYSVDQNGPGSNQRLADDLHDCKMATFHRYFHEHGAEIALAGIAGGAVGGIAHSVAAGAVTGAVAGAVATQTSDGELRTTADLGPAISRCMATKGYTGTSD